MNKAKSLTFIVPVLNEENNIQHLVQSIEDNLPTKLPIEYQFLFIDDGSNDNSWEIIGEMSKKKKSVKGIRLSRNFGKESALRVGLESAATDAVLTIDCDLQHPTSLLGEMIGEWFNNGTPVVETKKSSRQPESVFMKIFAKTFYRMYEVLNGKKIDGASDFKLLDRIVVEELKKMPERTLFYRGAVDWLGFEKKTLDFVPNPRYSGVPGWGTLSLTKYAINSLFCFSFRPLYFVLILYFIYGFLAFVLIGLALYNWAAGHSAEGFPTTYLIILLSFGLLFISLTILTGYITIIFTEVKGRQQYVVSEITKN